MNVELVANNLVMLVEKGFEVERGPKWEWVCISGFDLPGVRGGWTDERGQVVYQTSVLVDIPPDFPMSPPGVGFNHPSRAIHLPLIYYKGGVMAELYKCRHAPWYWFCFQNMDWNPQKDNLLTLLVLVEASISERLKKAGLW